jgi:hypothetical protein
LKKEGRELPKAENLELPVLRYYIESINELNKPMQILEQAVQM